MYAREGGMPLNTVGTLCRSFATLQAYSGSKRTFSALVKTMAAKDKIGLALGTMRHNSVPMFYAMLPQVCHSIRL